MEGSCLKNKIISLFLILSFVFLSADLLAAGKKAKPVESQAITTNDLFVTNSYLYTTPEQDRKPFSVFFTVLQTLIVLVIVGFVLYYFLKFIMKKQSTGNINKELIRVISQNSLAVGKYITIARIMSHYYVLSISDSQINLIQQVTEKDEIDRLKVLESEMPTSQDVTFSDYIQEIARPIIGKKDAVTGETTDGVINFLKKQKERLNKLNGDRK